MRNYLCASAFLVALTVCACTTQPQYKILPAHSGRLIKIMQVSPMTFAQGEKALMLSYQTDYSIDDKQNLFREVADVWSSFRDDVERAGYSSAIISANEASKSGVLGFSNSRGFNFAFEKEPSGTWRCANDPAIVKPDALYREAMAASQKGEFKQTITSINELLALWPNSAELYANRAACYLVTNDPKKALPDCSKAISLNPQSDVAYSNRGAVYGTLGDYPHALEDFDKALSLNPTSEAGHMNRGELLVKTNKFEDAVKDLTFTINANPKSGEAYFYRAEAYMKLGKKEEAEKDSAQANALGYREGMNTINVK